MSEKSPLFISAMELLSHAVELLEQNNPKKNKFVVLHLSNAVELLLKDMLIDLGGSIFENNSKTTINIWTAFKAIEGYGLSFPKKPQIEILIDDRNAIQHKFGYPSEECVVYYLGIAVDLFRDCISKQYAADFDDIAPQYFSRSGLALVGVVDRNDFDKVDAIAKYDLLSAVAMAYGILEMKVYSLLGLNGPSKPVMIWHDPRFYQLLNAVDRACIDGEHPKKYFDSIRQLRNVAVHRQHFDLDSMGRRMKDGLPRIRKLTEAIEAIPKERIQAICEQDVDGEVPTGRG